MTTFIKLNQSSFLDQLIKEASGLNFLKKHVKTHIKIPDIFHVDEKKLMMQKIKVTPFSDLGLKNFAIGLAEIHEQKERVFGLNEDNYIGLNPQINQESKSWGYFFLQQRLSLQVEFIEDTQIKDQFREILQNKAPEIIDFLNDHSPHPSPVHGDLWSGNILYDGDSPWLIDPAFYYGDREVDIAMTQLFGGLSKLFYHQYQKEYPLKKGFKDRFIIYNFYHYLNHYNLFGNSYLPHCLDAIRKLKCL